MQLQLRPVGALGGQRVDPRRDRVRGGPHERRALPRDGRGGAGPVLAGEVVVDRLDRSTELVERRRDPPGNEPLLALRMPRTRTEP